MHCQCSGRGTGTPRGRSIHSHPRPSSQPTPPPAMTTDHGRRGDALKQPPGDLHSWPIVPLAGSRTMGIDFHLISNFGALALITLAGPAVIFILYYRRGAL